MHDPLHVGTGQAIEHLGHQSQRLAHPEPPLALERLAERLARHVGEDRVELAFGGLARVDQLHDEPSASTRWSSTRSLTVQTRYSQETRRRPRRPGFRAGTPTRGSYHR